MVERDAFRIAFPELCENPKEEREDRLAFVVLVFLMFLLAAILA